MYIIHVAEDCVQSLARSIVSKKRVAWLRQEAARKAQEERERRRTATVKIQAAHRKRMAILKASQLQRASVIINGVFRICLAGCLKQFLGHR